MKFYKIIFLLTALSWGLSYDNGDTLILNPITWETPSPEGWNAQYKISIQFPDSNLTWHKIFMIQTLKCDPSTKGDEYPCGEWDYIWNTIIETESKGLIDTFSIGSFVTPYGKWLELGSENEWSWTYDITDYAPILKGSSQITTGNNQELLDLKFLFISGTPERETLSVVNLYSYGEYKYESLSNDQVLKAKSILLHPDASGYKIKSVISGHGHAGPKNCCEWDSKTHTYYLNGWRLFRWGVWKDCGNNPIYPQGGTWPFDRAGWCPGTKVDEYEFELTDHVIPGDSILFDYGIEPYKENGEKEGHFRMSHQLFSYGKPNFKYDAEISDIIIPSSEKKHTRVNPSLGNPIITIKNTGKYNLKSLEVHYGLKNRRKSVYKWKGNLNFLEKENVILPIPLWNSVKKNRTFEVKVKNPNFNTDENQINNHLTSEILLPIVLPKEFFIDLKTNDNNRARENSLIITDKTGKVYLFESNFSDNKNHRFKVNLNKGHYTFLLKDDLEDGISHHWWYKNSAPKKVGITGKIELTSKSGETLHSFKPDFGKELLLNFLIGYIP